MKRTPGDDPDRTARILIVDDEEAITDLVTMALRYEGFETATAFTGQQALDAVATSQPDLVVLDVMLPDIDGFTVCERLRSRGEALPALFLTARETTEDKVRGLTLGGDDYLTKPFGVSELVARVRAILRRSGFPVNAGSRLVVADLELEPETGEVRRAGRAVDLTATELKLLSYLMSNQGRVLSRHELLDHVWNHDFGGDARVLETYISYLRRKIDDVEPRLINTVRGVGYSLRPPRR
ncbi:MAG: response regulator transcription factor [Frankia sp.]